MSKNARKKAGSNSSPKNPKNAPRRKREVEEPTPRFRRLAIFSSVAAVLFLVIVVVFGTSNTTSNTARDPMTGATEFNIPVQDAALVAEGADLYLASCAACHGADLRGTVLGPSQLSVIYQPGHHSDQSYTLAAFAGVQAHHWDFGNMPPVPGVTQDDMDRIIAFIRETQRTQGFEPYPPS